MANTKEELLKRLSECVVEMEDEVVVDIANEYVENGYDAYEGIAHGLAHGMDIVGQLYEDEEYFIPDLLLCSDAMYEGIDILKPHLVKEDGVESLKAVVGVVEGDTHDIGKNLFRIMLETSGFEVYDLGRDVPCRDFIEKAREVGANLIGMSTLMTTTMDNMKVVIDMLKEENMRDDIIVMVGGGPISQSFATEIGADLYVPDASKGAKVAKENAVNKVQNKEVI
ncbi:MAG: corrinoid protein [Clostridioides sp.]|jgi:corrinoid protein of di/trimethylamine methyltransferase|nr:corrinoid protein [Clostridioides sp.]